MLKMQKLICLFTLLSTMVFPVYAKQHLDKIVAVVNDDVITQSQMQDALTTTKKQLAFSHARQLKREELQKVVLDQLINKQLQLQLAKQAGIQVDDKMVEGAIHNIASQN